MHGVLAVAALTATVSACSMPPPAAELTSAFEYNYRPLDRSCAHILEEMDKMKRIGHDEYHEIRGFTSGAQAAIALTAPELVRTDFDDDLDVDHLLHFCEAHPRPDVRLR